MVPRIQIKLNSQVDYINWSYKTLYSTDRKPVKETEGNVGERKEEERKGDAIGNGAFSSGIMLPPSG